MINLDQKYNILQATLIFKCISNLLFLNIGQFSESNRILWLYSYTQQILQYIHPHDVVWRIWGNLCIVCMSGLDCPRVCRALDRSSPDHQEGNNYNRMSKTDVGQNPNYKNWKTFSKNTHSKFNIKISQSDWRTFFENVPHHIDQLKISSIRWLLNILTTTSCSSNQLIAACCQYCDESRNLHFLKIIIYNICMHWSINMSTYLRKIKILNS